MLPRRACGGSAGGDVARFQNSQRVGVEVEGCTSREGEGRGGVEWRGGEGMDETRTEQSRTAQNGVWRGRMNRLERVNE